MFVKMKNVIVCAKPCEKRFFHREHAPGWQFLIKSPERERVGHSATACRPFARSVTFGALTHSDC
jgi:hypothetical protein